MRLAPEFDVVGHAVLIVQVAGCEGIRWPSLKVLAGRQQDWRHDANGVRRSVEDYVRGHVLPVWEGRFGPIGADLALEGCWAQHFKADGMAYDGRVQLAPAEQRVINLAGACDVPIGLVWAMIEGLGWRPGMSAYGRLPSSSEIRSLYEWWDHNDDPEYAVTQAVWMATFDRRRSNADADRLIASLLDAAGIPLRIGMVQTHHLSEKGDDGGQ